MKLGNRIGVGTYGEVYEGTDSRGQKCAIKCFKIDTSTEGIDIGVLREIVYLKSLPAHPNIIQLQEIEWLNCKLRITMPLYKCDLNDHIKKGAAFTTDADKRSLLRQTLLGLEHIHRHGVFHRDLKPSNILIDESGKQCVICDFSLASNWCSKIDHSMTVQTLWYRAVEIMLGDNKYSTAIDMWSFGCLVGFFGKSSDIMMGDSDYGQLIKIFQFLGTPTESSYPGISGMPNYSANWPKFPAAPLQYNLSNALFDIMMGCLDYLPEKRWTAAQALVALEK